MFVVTQAHKLKNNWFLSFHKCFYWQYFVTNNGGLKKHQLDCEYTQYDEDDENVEKEDISDSFCQTIFNGSQWIST
jgi:hypothetical protein